MTNEFRLLKAYVEGGLAGLTLLTGGVVRVTGSLQEKTLIIHLEEGRVTIGKNVYKRVMSSGPDVLLGVIGRKKEILVRIPKKGKTLGRRKKDDPYVIMQSPSGAQETIKGSSDQIRETVRNLIFAGHMLVAVYKVELAKPTPIAKVVASKSMKKAILL